MSTTNPKQTGLRSNLGFRAERPVMSEQDNNIGLFTTATGNAPHNDVWVNDGPHIRRWSHKIIIYYYNTIMLDLYSLPSIVREVKSRRMRWAGHMACMGEGRGVHRVLVGKPEGKRSLGRPRRRWEDNINTFTAIVDLSRFNNSCLKSPASTLVDLTFQSRALRSALSA